MYSLARIRYPTEQNLFILYYSLIYTSNILISIETKISQYLLKICQLINI